MKKAVKVFVSLMTSGLFISHFLIVALFLSPDNPIKHQYKYQTNSYISPYFAQNWSLFAPNPVNTNVNLLLQFRKSATSDAQWDSTGWLDVSEPLIEERHDKFWSNSPRLLKFISSTIQDVQKVNRSVAAYIQKTDSLQADSAKAVAFYDNAIKHSLGHITIIQYARHVLKNYNNEHASRYPFNQTEVSYRFADLSFPRFSERHLPLKDPKNNKLTGVTSAWYPLEERR